MKQQITLTKDEFIQALSFMKYLDKYPERPLPPGSRELLTKIMIQMETENQKNERIVSEWIKRKI